MRLVIIIDLGNEAMVTSQDVIEAIRHSRLAGTDPEPLAIGEQGRISDRNGNRVGGWHVEGDI